MSDLTKAQEKALSTLRHWRLGWIRPEEHGMGVLPFKELWLRGLAVRRAVNPGHVRLRYEYKLAPGADEVETKPRSL